MTLRRVLLVACAVAAASASGSSGSSAGGSHAVVQRIVDGATIEVRHQGRVQTVRLVGIRAPRRGQCGYAGSRRSLGAMLKTGGVVQLARDRKHYRAAGVPAGKIVLGVPFYGRAFKGVPNANGGLYQAFDGVPQGTWNDGSGMYDFWDIEQHYLPTYTRHWQAEAKVPWLFNPATGIMISYDDPESLQAKAGYAKAKDLGGVMIWELSQDDASNKLVHALADGLARVR